MDITKTQKTDDSDWTIDPLSVYWGDTISYMITITNTFEEAVDLIIRDALSGLVEYIGALTGTVYEDENDEDGTSVMVTEAIFSDDGWGYSGLEYNEILTISFDVEVESEDGGLADWWIENAAWVDAYIGSVKVVDSKQSNTVKAEIVPEPATVFFVGLGLFGILVFALRRRKQKK